MNRVPGVSMVPGVSIHSPKPVCGPCLLLNSAEIPWLVPGPEQSGQAGPLGTCRGKRAISGSKTKGVDRVGLPHLELHFL